MNSVTSELFLSLSDCGGRESTNIILALPVPLTILAVQLKCVDLHGKRGWKERRNGRRGDKCHIYSGENAHEKIVYVYLLKDETLGLVQDENDLEEKSNTSKLNLRLICEINCPGTAWEFLLKPFFKHNLCTLQRC